MKTVDEIYGELLASFGKRTGLEPREGCDLSARFYALAAQVCALYIQADWVVRQAFPQTAEGEYLDRHAQLRSLERRPASAAEGVVRFTAGEAATAPRTIPRGTVCMTAGLVRFETTGDAVLEAGELTAEVTYTLQDRSLELRYTASSTRTTLCNLTNHAYFNLSGHGSGLIDGQYIQLLAGRHTPVGEALIPTGAIDPVDGTALDLRDLQPIGGRAYDNNWAIDGWDGTLRSAARVWSPDTGILMETLTTLPGIQFYTGNFLDGCPRGKQGAHYLKRCAFCLETQYFPDSPNHAAFPSAVLPAGAVYESKTVYRFTTAETAEDAQR